MQTCKLLLGVQRDLQLNIIEGADCGGVRVPVKD